MILAVVRTINGVDVNVIMAAPMVGAVDWLEQSRIVVASPWLVSTWMVAHQPTPAPCVVTG